MKGLYFLPIGGLLNSFCLELLESILEADTDIEDAYRGKIRPSYLEREVDRLLRSAIPDSRVYTGLEWTDPTSGKLYENDAVVMIGSTLLIAEAKSASIHPSARRGGEMKLLHDLDELVVEPARQSHRFIQLLEENRREHVFTQRDGIQVRIDSQHITEFIPVSVSLAVSAMHLLRWEDLKRDGLVPADVALYRSFRLLTWSALRYFLGILPSSSTTSVDDGR